MPSFPYSGPYARPWIPEIGYVLNASADRQEQFELDLSSDNECSQMIPEIPEIARRKTNLCFISFERGYLSHVARAEVRYKAQSGNDRLDLWSMVALPTPISIETLSAALGGRRAGTTRETLARGGHLSPTAFQSVMEGLRSVDARAYRVANGLFQRESREPHALPAQVRENWSLQRDAVVTALDIAKIPRVELGVPPQPPPDIPPEIISIFDNAEAIHGLEDILVLHDLNGAEGWDAVKAHRYPARTFRYGDSVLSIVLANKLPLERQLGVDLVYINETLKSLVFVQYKVMRGADGEGGYRPDGQLEKEIERMDRVARLLADVSPETGCDGYRLNADAFYLKFCKGVLEHQDAGMVPGHYLPLEFWKHLAADPRVKGARGGIKITPTNLPRFLTATDFKDLVARAWIGTTSLQTGAIIPMIQEIIAIGRTVAVAIKSQRPEATPEIDDYLEDDED